MGFGNQKGENEKEEEGEMASENGVEDDSQDLESDNDIKDDSQETESSSLEMFTTFHSENPCERFKNSKVYGTLIMK